MDAFVTLDQAETIMKRAREAAAAMGLSVSVAIVNSEANMVAFQRMDEAAPGAGDIALKKARAAALFRRPSSDLGQTTDQGQPFRLMELSNGGLITFGGGLPLFDKRQKCIGAVGVSGSPQLEQDEHVAAMAAQALKI